MALASVPGVIFSPSPTKVPTPTNYLGADDFDFLNQYMPELYNKIHDRFGSQDVTGMLEAMGKEMPFASDNIKWTEEGRLTQLGTGVTRSANVFTLNGHTFRANETIVVQNADGSVERQGLITEVTTNTFTALCGDALGWTALGTTALKVYADSNEFKKKTDGMAQSLNSQVEHFEQTPVIVKEMVDESGSNLAQITWIEVTDSNGGTGYVWYFKNYKDTEKRFKNAIETKLIRGRRWAGDLAAAGYGGTQGLFEITEEGNVFGGLATDLEDFDSIIERCNAQGMIADNYIYGTAAQNLAIDDMLKDQGAMTLGWGAFDNNKDMALNLGFSGFKRGGYEFSYSRWRFLDNPTTEGSNIGANKVHAVMIPSGSKAVYDVIKGESATQPMLHVRYRANAKTNRKYKMSVRDFDNGTSNGNDSLTVDFITERALVCLGRNNTFIFKG
jgi:hypothetical protein